MSVAPVLSYEVLRPGTIQTPSVQMPGELWEVQSWSTCPRDGRIAADLSAKGVDQEGFAGAQELSTEKFGGLLVT